LLPHSPAAPHQTPGEDGSCSKCTHSWGTSGVGFQVWSETISAKTPPGTSALCVTLRPEKDAACEQNATLTGVCGPTLLALIDVSHMDNDSYHTLHILHFSLMQTLCQQSAVDRMDFRVWHGWLHVSVHQLTRKSLCNAASFNTEPSAPLLSFAVVGLSWVALRHWCLTWLQRSAIRRPRFQFFPQGSLCKHRGGLSSSHLPSVVR